MQCFASLIVICLALSLLAGCGGNRSKEGKEAGDILIWGRGADAKGLDPGKEEDGEPFVGRVLGAGLQKCVNLFHFAQANQVR